MKPIIIWSSTSIETINELIDALVKGGTVSFTEILSEEDAAKGNYYDEIIISKLKNPVKNRGEMNVSLYEQSSASLYREDDEVVYSTQWSSVGYLPGTEEVKKSIEALVSGNKTYLALAETH